MKPLLLALLFVDSLSSCTHKNWRVIHEEGKLHFVYINNPDPRDIGIYWESMAQICKDQEGCRVVYWDKMENIPTSAAGLEEGLKTSTADFNHAQPDHNVEITWACRTYPVPSCVER